MNSAAAEMAPIGAAPRSSPLPQPLPEPKSRSTRFTAAKQGSSPQALQAGDSFFAEERSDIPGRTYVGVLASGLSSHVVAQIRTTAALLQAPADLRGIVADVALDPYWSLVAYFNSLRELGRASTLIQADIREYLNWIWQRTGVSESRTGEGPDLRRFINHHVELTSRVHSAEIPEVLERLFTALPDGGAVDVCFATNMIQVGLDVPRLSLMMIVGQPKGASEYIQASSRVGRDIQKPGVVVTNYNPFKPRDRSHFETFRQYHEAIYRYVEPTSVTPFSLPVLERAIHALAVALIRCFEPTLRDRPGGRPVRDAAGAYPRDRYAPGRSRCEGRACAGRRRARPLLRRLDSQTTRALRGLRTGPTS